jgi:hypothetical protein
MICFELSRTGTAALSHEVVTRIYETRGGKTFIDFEEGKEEGFRVVEGG